ncbi:MAG: metallophosphoesterase [Promethearchaeota archaeon]
MNKTRRILKNIANTTRITLGIISLITASLFLVAALVLFQLFQFEIMGNGIHLVVGISSAAFSFVLMLVLDRSKKFKEKLQISWEKKFKRDPERESKIKKLTFRWLIIAPLSMSLGIVLTLVYYSRTNLDFSNFIETILNSTENVEFLVYLSSYLLFQAFFIFTYFGLKHFSPKVRVHRVKFPIFAGSSISAFSFMVYLALSLLPTAPENVIKTYEHDDGPWATWGTNDPTTEVTITWLTKATNPTILSYGTNASNLNNHVTAKRSGHLHRVSLTGLTPDTVYYYEINVNFEQDHKNTTFSFRTAPTVARPFSFSLLGDMQPTRGSPIATRNKMVVEGIVNQSSDFFIQLGDAADTGSLIEEWHLVLDSLSLGGATQPLQIAVGNHDYGGDQGANWARIFKYPFDDITQGKYFSFDYLNAHFVMIDSNRLTQTQIAWIESDLIAANASTSTDWIFCTMHVSIISSGTANSDWLNQGKLIPLFDKYGVDAVFYGHDHHYEAFNYTYGNEGLVHDPSHTWSHNPVLYFESGGGGANLETGGYGLTSITPFTIERTWYNISSGSNQVVQYYRNPWNSSKYMDFSGDPNLNLVAPGGLVYYQEPTEEIYQEDVLHYGYIYGENAYHYMLVNITGTTCTISARYPNGDVMTGPGGTNIQQFTLTKP